MIGHATINENALKGWISEQKDLPEPSKNWYSALWMEYFFHKRDIFKDSTDLLDRSAYGNINDRSDGFFTLLSRLREDGQKLCVYYADDTAVIVGYMGHRYTLPADLVEVEYLKDYSRIASDEMSLLGDKEMSGQMLPAGMDGDSIASLNDELNEKKDEIRKAEKEWQHAIDEIRKEAARKEQELKDLMEKETEKLRLAKEELEKKIYILDTQIYGIRCYLGEVIDFIQIRKGEPAASDVPIVMFQKIRFLDEEMGKYLSLYGFGAHEGDNGTLIGALRARDDFRDVFCPADRCITILRNSRTGKAVRPSDKVANMLERYEYLHGRQIAILIRDGENLYIGWTDEEKVSLSSEDMFLRPGEASVKEVEDTEYGFGHRYWSERERIRVEKEAERAATKERISRYFLISVLQGLIDRGGLINIPQKTRITEESSLVRFSFAEGWLKDSTYGYLADILDRSKDIGIKKGEVVLTGMRVTRDDIHDHSGRYSSEYGAYSNDRGIGEKNRTHGAYIPGFKFMPINKVLKSAKLNVTFDLMKGTPVINDRYRFTADGAYAYDVVKDSSGEKIGSYTAMICLDKDDFNAAGTLDDYEKVIMIRFKNRPLWQVDEEGRIRSVGGHATRYEWLPDLAKCGVPEIKDIEVLHEERHAYISVPTESGSGARVNFEIMPDECLRTTYLCSTWVRYAITTGNIGDLRMSGTKLSYAEALKYLNKLLEHISSREEKEKSMIEDAGGKKWLQGTPDWDVKLCEWRIANKISELTPTRAKKFLKCESVVL